MRLVRNDTLCRFCKLLIRVSCRSKWMNRVIAWYDAHDIDSGPVFRTRDGKQARQGQLELSILNRLCSVIYRKIRIFTDKNVNVMTYYSTRRSF